MEPVSPPPAGSSFGMFVPMIVMTVPFLIVLGFIAKRKGFHPALAVLIGIFPIANVVFALYLASKTDLSVLKRLSVLEKDKSDIL